MINVNRGIFSKLFLYLTVVVAISGCDQSHFSLRLMAVDPSGGTDASISPDGRYFVSSSRRSGNLDLWRYDLETAQWSQLTTDPADDYEAQWSPDGLRLAFTSNRSGNGDVWVLSLADRSTKQITSSTYDDEYPAWSPDGKTIVYVGSPWKARDIYLVSREGGLPRKLTQQSSRIGACSFNPDGKSLVCHKYDHGSGDIFRISIPNKDLVTLTSGRATDYKPTVSPDGNWMAFSRSFEGPSAIWLMPLNGKEPLQLISTSYDDRWPTWTASNARLFFHRVVEQGTAIKIIDQRSSGLKTIVGEAEKPLQASFDPQAQNIVYCAEENGKKVLRILNLLTQVKQTLNIGDLEACFPRWSPNGEKIAFVSKKRDRWEISTMDLNGTNLSTWTESFEDLKGMYGPIDWSPDGSRIVFHAGTKAFETDLYMIDTKSGQIENLTNDEWFDEAPSWTPDGNGILFMSTRGGNWTWGFFRLSLRDGSVDLVSGPDYIEKNYPRMGKDGWIAWSTYNNYGIQYTAEKSPSGQVRVLGSHPGSRWPSYSLDGRLLLFTTINRSVEYWLASNLLANDSPLLNNLQGSRQFTFNESADARSTKPPPWDPLLIVIRSPMDHYRRCTGFY